MTKVAVKVANDHLESLAKIRNPLIAVEELVWNSLDADATSISVTLSETDLGGLSEITVKDNGAGISLDNAKDAFGSLGGSKKLTTNTSPAGRVHHGKSGKGRFRAFGVGRVVTWVFRYKENGKAQEFTITGNRTSIREFEIGPSKEVRGKHTGVVVTISGIEQNYPSLTNTEAAAQELSRRLALYLKKYPGIEITYDGKKVDPAEVEEHTATYPVTFTVDGVSHDAELTVIEWKIPTERALYFCDESGSALEERSPGIQAPGFHFTAYFKSPIVKQLSDEGHFAMDLMHPTVAAIVETVRETLKRHFRARESKRSKDLVQQWREEEVYPFKETAKDPISQAEQEVFNVCAIKVHEYLPGFDKAERKSKKLTFTLIREALENNPTALQTILHEVLNLPQEHQNDLAKLLGRTKLASIINSAKTVVDRLDFLGSLDVLLFGDLKATLLERRHLHRILVEELWLFGDQYSLGVDDESLKSLLIKHVAELGREDIAPETEEVTDLEGKERILDLMLYRRYPQFVQNRFEHLVIELKRPTCRIGQKEINQIENYAFSVAADERFDKVHTNWTFFLIGNELDRYAENRCKVQGKEYGHIHASDDGAVNIYLKKWSSILDEAKWRYKFFHEKLTVQVKSSDGLEYLRTRHSQNLPKGDSDSTL